MRFYQGPIDESIAEFNKATNQINNMGLVKKILHERPRPIYFIVIWASAYIISLLVNPSSIAWWYILDKVFITLIVLDVMDWFLTNLSPGYLKKINYLTIALLLMTALQTHEALKDNLATAQDYLETYKVTPLCAYLIENNTQANNSMVKDFLNKYTLQKPYYQLTS